MKKIHLPLLYLTFVLLTACGGDKKGDTTTLTGEIKGLRNDTLYLYGMDKLYAHTDTIALTDGKFQVTLSPDTLVGVWLQLTDGSKYPLFLNKGEEIKIKGSIASLQAMEVKGNQANEEMTAYLKQQNELAQGTEEVQQKAAAEFIVAHPSSLVSVYLLEQYFIQVPHPDYQRLSDLVESLSGELKDRPSIVELQNYLQAEEKVSIGKTVPYFRVPDLENKQTTRSDFKDQYLLLCFWASWDNLSRKDNVHWKELYHKEQKNKRFAILSISLDIKEEAWKKAIEQDTLKWKQACDFNGWQSDVARQFNIQALPANYLIAPNGHIEGKNLTAEEVEQKLREAEQKEKKQKEAKAPKRP